MFLLRYTHLARVLEPTPFPACPRCAYDQSGATAAWNDACPLQGTCPECGLVFFWGDLLNPRLDSVLQYFEHAPTRRFRALRCTVSAVHRPTRYWSAYLLHYPLRISRLIAFAALGTLYSWFRIGIVAGLLWFLADGLSELASTGAFFGGRSAWNASGSIIPTTIARVIPGFCPGCRVDVFWFTPGVFSNLRLTIASYWVPWSALTAAILPTFFILLPATRRLCRIRMAHILRVFAGSLVTIPTLLAVWPAMESLANLFFACHIALHGNAWPPPPSLAYQVGSYISHWRDEMLVFLTLLWLSWFWCQATSRYLRLPFPFIITALALIFAGMIAWLLLDLIPGAGERLVRQLTP